MLSFRSKRVCAPRAASNSVVFSLVWKRALLIGCAVLAGLPGLLAAQDYPSRQIVIIVPFPAGGPTDALARLIAEPMRAALGQPVVVQNVSGAGATIGVGRAIQSPPDGYTLSLGNWTSHVGGPAAYKVSWNVLTDLEPIALLSTSALLIVGRSGLPVKDGGELISWLKAKPEPATAATVGAGSGAHVCGIYFEQKTGTRLRYIAYRGGAPAVAAVLGNEVDLFCGEASQMLPHARAGKLKPLVAMTKTRWRPLPEVPTMEEIGASDAYIAFWHGLWAPKGTPKPIIAKLNEAAVKAFEDPLVVKRLNDLGHEIPPREQMRPEALAAFHKAEIEKWWPLIRAAVKIE
jgi:tripartite-type tricarboxylate transporter receptor subunit TctC